ncbi:MAG: hypothetical protein ABS949_09915 [Solibacillus sp.]
MECWHISERNGLIQVMGQVTQYEGVFHTCEYHRENGKLVQIGVRADQAKKVIVQQFEQLEVPLTYNEEYQIWYHARSFWQDGGYEQKTDGIFGINAGGSFILKAYDANGELLEEQEVVITPANMSLEEYHEMQYEVQRLLEIFSMDYASNSSTEEVKFSTIHLPFFPLSQLTKILRHFDQILVGIAVEPSYTLTTVSQKMQRQHITKWDAKTILQSEMSATEKVRVNVQEASQNIQEHRMLRYMLQQFDERIQLERNVEDNYLVKLEAELAELVLAIDRERSAKLLATMKNQRIHLQKDREQLKARAKSWQAVATAVQAMLEYDFLRFGEQEVEETHLFRMHPLYSELYMSYMEYESLLPVYSPSLRLFIQSILKSPTLYEIWVLLKLLERFQIWGADCHQFYEEIMERYAVHGTISGYVGQFELVNKPFNLRVYYDYKHEGNGLRPDFMLEFFTNDAQYTMSQRHFLDAKYKAYHVMNGGVAELREDLRHSARRYLERFVQTAECEYKSASIIHPDVPSTWWNVMGQDVNPQQEVHRYAHFAFTPRNQQALAIYLKRILHESSGAGHCCPNCASAYVTVEYGPKIAQGREVRKWKVTYICESCHLVWVANYCRACVNNHRHLIPYYDHLENRHLLKPTPLYKYATNNFNVQVRDQWNVHCPACFATANNDDVRYRTDLLTGQYEIEEDDE